MEIQLINSEGRELNQNVPDLKLGEGIGKLKISVRNMELIEEFLNELRCQNTSEQTVKDKYRSPLITMAFVLNMDFDKAKREDIKKLNVWISTTSRYEYYRKENLRICLKRAFRFWKGSGEHNPEEVWDVVRPRSEKKPKPKKPRYLLKTDEEVDRIVNVCKNNRDKLYIALSWNCGGRCIEVQEAKWEQIYEEDGIFKIDIDTAKKSGDEDDRIVDLYYALPYYYRWKQEYMERFNVQNESDLKDMFIFRHFECIRGKKSKNPEKKIFPNSPLSSGYYLKIFEEIGNKLNIPNFTPKIFRKYAISYWERQGIPHALIKKMSGHSKNSRAIEHYSFHDEEDCSIHFKRINNMDVDVVKVVKKPTIIICKRCDKPNSSGRETCEFCGFALSQTAMINQQTLFKSQIGALTKQIEEKSKIENERWDKLLTILQNNPDETKTMIKKNKELVKELISK